MKLLQVYAANGAWGKLTQLKLPAKLAYQLMKYAKLVADEYTFVETTRVELIHQLTNTKAGENAEIAVGTQAHEDYVKQFGAMLDVESDLKPSELKLEDVVDKLDSQGNSLTAQDIGMLEPFFTA
jgi:hypothetical protein